MNRFIVLLSLLMAGCGTIGGTIAYGPKIFVGMRVFTTLAWGNLALALVDLPFSFALDVAILPISIIYEILLSLSKGL